MIDQLMGAYASNRYKNTDPNYSPEMAIVATELTNEDAHSLTVLFPPWRGGDFAYERLADRLNKNGSAVLRYKFNPQLLEPNVDRVLESFTHIQSTVTSQIDELTTRHSYERVSFVASSLGNVSMALVMRAFPNFDDAIFIVAGSNLARCVWDGSRTQAIRQSLAAQGMTEEKLDAAWANIAPELSARVTAGKKITVIQSTTDAIIPARYQSVMAKSLAEYCSQLDIQKTNLGHLAAIGKYCFLG